MNYMSLNNSERMPQLGFGVYQILNEETVEAVYKAIVARYRLIDTSVSYGNKVKVGTGIERVISNGVVATRDCCTG